jgi:hypothetical protein
MKSLEASVSLKKKLILIYNFKIMFLLGSFFMSLKAQQYKVNF